MKLYDAPLPNPKIVRMFLWEKGLEIPRVQLDVVKGENRGGEHLKRNPSGQVPALELDDGTFLSEVTAICDYLEELHPAPALIGATPVERARTRMWARKIDLNICEPMTKAFWFGEGLRYFEGRIHVEPDMSAGLKRIAQSNLKWLDTQLSDKAWIAGERFSLADIMLFAIQQFFGKAGQPLDPDLANVTNWYERVRARPSAKA